MQNIKKGAEIVEDRMTFIQEFLQKKYAWGIVFFVIIICGFITAVFFYNNGLKTGKENSTDEIASLKKSSKNDDEEINTLKGRVAYYKKQLDTCNKSSNSSLEDQINKKLDEADRLKRIFERKVITSEKINEELKTVIK